MTIENFESLLKSYVENTQGISDFAIDGNRTRYHMCGIEGQAVIVIGHNMNTHEEFCFKFIVADIQLWYVNKRFESLEVSCG